MPRDSATAGPSECKLNWAEPDQLAHLGKSARVHGSKAFVYQLYDHDLWLDGVGVSQFNRNGCAFAGADGFAEFTIRCILTMTKPVQILKMD